MSPLNSTGTNSRYVASAPPKVVTYWSQVWNGMSWLAFAAAVALAFIGVMLGHEGGQLCLGMAALMLGVFFGAPALSGEKRQVRQQSAAAYTTWKRDQQRRAAILQAGTSTPNPAA